MFKQDGKQCAEIESWTYGGVDMIIYLEPFIKEEFIKFVDEYFDIDEEIELHRQDERYKQAFTISQSVKDFEKYINNLESIKNKLENL